MVEVLPGWKPGAAEAVRAKALFAIGKRGGVVLFRGKSIPSIMAELFLLDFWKVQSHEDGS
jgi:hypothetical protein